MNNRERQQLERIHDCLSIPLPKSVRESVVVRSLKQYEADMSYAVENSRKILRWIATSEPWEGAIEAELTDLELWRSRRVKADWH